ncbi:MAG TPA: AsmA-like C-terminal region-containing protein, partial [Flavitalea sp.]|nr:AsmA-like C-terminal region-containing protein [Flavitalea sp.]
KFEKIPLSSKNIKVSNLRNPYLECDIKSSFALSSLNELTGSSTLQFEKGTGKIDVSFKGPISGRDSVKAGINGIVSINNATLKYLPRNFTLSQCTGNFLFEEKDLRVQKFSANTGSTELLMNGHAKNFLALLDISPEKLTLQWNVYSPHLHLKDFTRFLARRNIQTSQKAANNNFRRTAGKIDRMFTEGDVLITLTTPMMDYKRFDAKKVDAELLLTSNRIDLKNVSFGHANGSMKMVGTVTEGVNTNAVFLTSTMNKMDIPTLFYAFNNFGQDAITDKNLSGIVSATVNLNTAINDQAEVISESMLGTIDFLVENGELNDFEPLKKISISVFKKQDFSTIRFADLQNRLQVKGTAIIIDKMEIRSTALILFAEGVYDVKKGTDMSIKFPIRNMVKKNDSIDLISSDIKTGPSIRVRAKTGDDGKLKISWDPFRRAIRNKKETEAN